jgi:hypothetical protein
MSSMHGRERTGFSKETREGNCSMPPELMQLRLPGRLIADFQDWGKNLDRMIGDVHSITTGSQ